MVLKALELKHVKKNLKRNVQEVKSSFHVVKRNKKGSSLFLETCYLSDFIDLWIIDSGGINHV